MPLLSQSQDPDCAAAKSLGPVLARGASWSLALQGAGAVVSFGVQVLLARVLGAEGIGEYLYVLAWMNAARLLALLGTDTAVLRFVGEYLGAQNWSLLRGFLLWVRRVVLSMSVTVALLGVAIVWFLRPGLDAGLVNSFWAAALLLPAATLLVTESKLLQGLRFVSQSASHQVVRPALFGLGLLTAMFVTPRRLEAVDAILLGFLATVGAVAVLVFFRRRAIPPEVKHSTSGYQSKHWWATSLGLAWIGVAQLVLSTQADVAVIGSYMTKVDVGLYGIAAQVVTIMALPMRAIVAVVVPYVSDFHARGMQRELQGLVRWSVLATSGFGLAGFLFILFFGRLILSLYGPEFLAGWQVLLVFAFGAMIGSVFGHLPGYLLTLTGHHHQAGVLTVASAILNIALMFALIPAYGAVGAAIATVIASLVKGLAITVLAQKRLGISVFAAFRIGG